MKTKIGLNMQEYLLGFNKLLLNDGFKEYFVLEERSYMQDARKIEYSALVLYNLNDENKMIDFIDNSSVYPEGVLSWFHTHQHFDFINYATEEWSCTQENIANVYETIKGILQDKLIEVRRDDEIKTNHVFDIFMNPDSLEYGKKEKKFLSHPDISFLNWSGKITENMKLFAIGFSVTGMSEIKKKQKEYLGNTHDE